MHHPSAPYSSAHRRFRSASTATDSESGTSNNPCAPRAGLVLHPANRANAMYALIAAAVMVPIASGLLFLAVRLRRRLRLLDAQADDPAATQ